MSIITNILTSYSIGVTFHLLYLLHPSFFLPYTLLYSEQALRLAAVYRRHHTYISIQLSKATPDARAVLAYIVGLIMAMSIGDSHSSSSGNNSRNTTNRKCGDVADSLRNLSTHRMFELREIVQLHGEKLLKSQPVDTSGLLVMMCTSDYSGINARSRSTETGITTDSERNYHHQSDQSYGGSSCGSGEQKLGSSLSGESGGMMITIISMINIDPLPVDDIIPLFIRHDKLLLKVLETICAVFETRRAAQRTSTKKGHHVNVTAAAVPLPMSLPSTPLLGNTMLHLYLSELRHNISNSSITDSIDCETESGNGNMDIDELSLLQRRNEIEDKVMNILKGRNSTGSVSNKDGGSDNIATTNKDTPVYDESRALLLCMSCGFRAGELFLLDRSSSTQETNRGAEGNYSYDDFENQSRRPVDFSGYSTSTNKDRDDTTTLTVDMLLRIYFEDNDVTNVLRLLRREGRNNPELSTKALQFLLNRPVSISTSTANTNANCWDVVQEALTIFADEQLLPPQQVLAILSTNPTLPLGVVSMYIERVYDDVAGDVEDLESKVGVLQGTVSELTIIARRKDLIGSCTRHRDSGAELLTTNPEDEEEVENRKLRQQELDADRRKWASIKRAQEERVADVEGFFEDLESSEDGFDTISQYFGKLSILSPQSPPHTTHGS